MPSKTSFFNKTTFRKDLTRFFPLWGLYTLCLLLGLVLIMDEREKFWIANNFAQLPRKNALSSTGSGNFGALRSSSRKRSMGNTFNPSRSSPIASGMVPSIPRLRIMERNTPFGAFR